MLSLLPDSIMHLSPVASDIFDRNITNFPTGALIHSFHHKSNFAFEKVADYVFVSYIMQNYWHYTVYIGLAYLLAMKVLEAWMVNRKPFDLRAAMTVWNGALAVFSTFGALRTTEEFVDTLSHHGIYKSLCYVFDPTSVAANWFLFFAVSKLFELGDTVFLVLRKKPLSFLHLWHHFSVLIYTFHAGAEWLGSGRWFMWMNFIAHSLMYTYFTAMSMGYRIPRSIARFVTIIQIAQMVVGVSVSFAVLGIKSYLHLPCQQTSANLYLCFTIYISYMILFLNFFFKAYCQPSKSATKDATLLKAKKVS